jgi:AP-3 complex subunit mu
MSLRGKPSAGFGVLHKIADTFADYFGTPTDENAIKENFSTVYQLLEEMLDNGWPLTTEPNALQDMIRPPSVMGKVSSFQVFRSKLPLLFLLFYCVVFP